MTTWIILCAHSFMRCGDDRVVLYTLSDALTRSWQHDTVARRWIFDEDLNVIADGKTCFMKRGVTWVDADSSPLTVASTCWQTQAYICGLSQAQVPIIAGVALKFACKLGIPPTKGRLAEKQGRAVEHVVCALYTCSARSPSREPPVYVDIHYPCLCPLLLY